MENGFNYQSVPHAYALCFNKECSISSECMRHLVAVHCPASLPTVNAINLNAVPEDTNTCTHFRPIVKLSVAWGIKHLFSTLPYDKVAGLRAQLINYFGKNVYYAVFRKECGLFPEQQAYIRSAFQSRGITEEPNYEFYTEEYRWK